MKKHLFKLIVYILCSPFVLLVLGAVIGNYIYEQSDIIDETSMIHFVSVLGGELFWIAGWTIFFLVKAV